MKYDYLLFYNDFFNKKIGFNDFKESLFNWFNISSIDKLCQFNDYIIDDSFTAYDPDMVMLTYIAVWLLPNRFNSIIEIQGADNMYMSFLKEVKDSYKMDFKNNLEILDNNLNYLTYKLGNIYIIINTTEMDIDINVPDELKNSTHYCVNCNDDIDIENSVELYPYGFYIIEK